MNTSKKPLCVDLDGTLVLTDVILESLFSLFKKEPLTIFRLFGWLRKGKHIAKKNIAQRIAVTADQLPFNKELLAWLKQEKANGRSIFLVTASSELYAKAISDHTNLFDDAFGSTDNHNLSGKEKAQKLIERFGDHGFAYAGNSKADIPVWQHADEIIVVNAPKSVRRRAAEIGTVVQQFGEQRLRLPVLLRAIRWHQWIKNTLLFVPLLTAHQLTNQSALLSAGVGFIAFCAISSVIYISNDLVDLPADRLHPYKKYRPLAAGKLPITTALKVGVVLAAMSFFISLFLPHAFLGLLATYVLLNIAYSLFLKRVVVVDVLLITSLYVLRILAGSAATNIATSPWLFAFAGFVFLSLALVKRVSEVKNLSQSNKVQAIGRGYANYHYNALMTAGIASSVVSLIVFGLYLNTPTVQSLYQIPSLLWLLIPIFGSWLLRVWSITNKGNMHEDPTVFAGKDPISYATVAAAIVVVLLSS